MLALRRTDPGDTQFLGLVALLDRELRDRDGPDHPFYARFNTLDPIRHAVIATDGDTAVACGAIKAFGDDAFEIKRMYSLPAWRSRGVATRVLRELEAWAAELGARRCVLETGQRQHEAVALYTGRGYVRIPNFGPYAGIANSLCFEKRLS